MNRSYSLVIKESHLISALAYRALLSKQGVQYIRSDTFISGDALSEHTFNLLMHHLRRVFKQFSSNSPRKAGQSTALFIRP